jgi:hypothetical protein
MFYMNDVRPHGFDVRVLEMTEEIQLIATSVAECTVQ